MDARSQSIIALCETMNRRGVRDIDVIDDDLLEGHERVYIYDPFGNRLEFLRPLEAGR